MNSYDTTGAAGTAGGTRNVEGDNSTGSFEDHAAFRDAMDDLGLLMGLGQQEVLTLVRSIFVFSLFAHNKQSKSMGLLLV